MKETDAPSSSKRSPWRDPAVVAAIVAGLFGVIVAIVGIVPQLRNNGDDPRVSPTPTPTATKTPPPTPTAVSGLTLLSPTAIEASASSTLPPQNGLSYSAVNTIDGDPQTAWSEGKPGPGLGAAITWTFRRRVDLRRVAILNGYVKGKLYAKNLRIRSARVTTAQGSRTAVLKDIDTYQRLSIPRGQTDFLRVEIQSVYGSQKYEDCLISEAEFYITAS